MPGARCTRSLVCAWGSKYAHEYSQRATGNHPAFPHAMVYGLYRALPGDRLSCHRHLAETWLVRARSGRLAFRETGRRRRGVRTTRLRRPRATSFVSMPVVAHGKPALRSLAHPTLPRPPQPAPTFTTMANAPLIAGLSRE